jgi:sec-independent protein translocase protein TatB
MLDFGFSELLLILVLGLFLIGPRDIPGLVYQLGRFVRRLQYVKFALSKQFDDFMEQADLQELRRGRGLGSSRFDVGDMRAALTLPNQDEDGQAAKKDQDAQSPSLPDEPDDHGHDPDDEGDMYDDIKDPADRPDTHQKQKDLFS